MPSIEDVTAIRTARTNAVTYARFRETGSVDDARKCATACAQLILLLPAQAERTGAESVRFELQRIESLRADAIKFANLTAAATSSSGITYFQTGGDFR